METESCQSHVAHNCDKLHMRDDSRQRAEKKPSLFLTSVETLLLGPSPLDTKMPTLSPTALQV